MLLDGHYLNLPVMNDSGEIVGMVDVLKLTYATLEQINTMSSGDSEGPAWNKFWLSLDHETESMVSGDGSHHHTHMTSSRMMSPELTRDSHGNILHGRGDSVAPGDSASHVGVESPPHSALAPITPELPPSEIPFPFKFKAPSGRVHRLQVTAAHGVAIFVENVASKLGAEADTIGGVPAVADGKIAGAGFAISYLDDEGDSVSITADQDLVEAVLLARHGHLDKVDLFVHDPSKPPVAVAAPIVQTPASSERAASGVRSRRGVTRSSSEGDEDEEDEDSEDSYVRKQKSKARRAARRNNNRSKGSIGSAAESVGAASKAFGEFAANSFGAGSDEPLIQGVPNDLLLPGAIVTLSVVILGVFTISRLTR